MTGHYDLAAAERAIRAQQEAMFDAAEARAGDDTTRRFLALQRELSFLPREVALWTMRSENAGVDEEMMLNAIGRVLGTVLMNLCANADEPAAAFRLLAEAVSGSMADLQSAAAGKQVDDVVSRVTEIVAEPGGHA